MCNIGGPEVARRKAVAKAGGLLFIIYAVFTLLTQASPSSAVLSFFPAMLFAVGYVQSKKKFCFAYGLMGTFNFAAAGKLTKVTDKEALVADRRAALVIIAQSTGIALVLSSLLALTLSL